MTVPTKNSLFETPRSMRRFLQHSHVVICLQHQYICRPHALDDQFIGMPEISQKTDVSTSSSNQKTDGILCIMRHHECLDANVANLKTATGREKAAIHAQLQLIFDRLLGRSIAINWQAQFLTKGC